MRKPDPNHFAHPDDFAAAEQAYRDHNSRRAWQTEEVDHWHCALVQCITEMRTFEWIADHYEMLQLMMADDDGMIDRREV